MVDASEPDAPSTESRPSVCATTRLNTNGRPAFDSKNETLAATNTTINAIAPSKTESAQRRRCAEGDFCGVVTGVKTQDRPKNAAAPAATADHTQRRSGTARSACGYGHRRR